MKFGILTLALTLTLTFSSSFAFAAKAYQVTGPVTAVGPKSITVKKGNESWELLKDPSTKAPDVKVGDKVTIYYTMTATEVEVKKAK